MAHEFIDLKGFLLLVCLAISLTSSTNIDCGGKPFTCLNSTHFMICVDLGGGVSSTIDDFIIPCPPTTECLKDNRFECEFPKIKEPTTPLYDINVFSQNEKSVSSKILDHVTTKSPDEATSLFLPEKRNTTVLSAFETTTFNLNNEVLKGLKDEFTEGNEKIFEENIVPLSKLNSTYDSDSPQKIYSPASVTDTVTDMTIDTLSTPEPILTTSFKKLDSDNIMASENVVNNSLTGKVNFPPTNNKFESTTEILKKDDKYKNIFPSVTVVPIAMTEVKLPVNDLGTDSLNLKGIKIFTEGLNNLNKPNNTARNYSLESATEILKKDDKYKNIFQLVTEVPIAITEVNFPVNDPGTDKQKIEDILTFTEGLDNLNKYDNTSRNYSLESTTETLKKDDKYKNIFQSVTEGSRAITEVNFPVNDPGTDRLKLEDIVSFPEGLDNFNKYNNTFRNHSLESTTETLKKDDKYKNIFQSVTEGSGAITEVNFPVNAPGIDRQKLEDIVTFTEGLDNLNKYDNTSRNYSLESTTETLKKDDKYKNIFQSVTEGSRAITEVNFPVNAPGTNRQKLEDIVTFTEGLDNLNKYDNTSRNYSLESTTETLKKDDKYKNIFQSVTEGSRAITEVNFPVNDPGTDRLKLEDIVSFPEGLDNFNKYNNTLRNHSLESTTETLKKDDKYKNIFQSVTEGSGAITEVNFPVNAPGTDRQKLEDIVTFIEGLDNLNKYDNTSRNYSMEPTTETLKKDDKYKNMFQSVTEGPMAITEVTPVNDPGTDRLKLEDIVTVTEGLDNLYKHDSTARNYSVESTTEVLNKDEIYKDKFQAVTVVPIKVPEVNFPVNDSGKDRPKIEDTVTFRDKLHTLNENNIAASIKHVETTTEILEKSDTYNGILRSVTPVPIETTEVTFPVTESGTNDPKLKSDVIFTGKLDTLNKHNKSNELNTPKEISENYISALNETLYKSANKLELTTTLPNITSDKSYNKEKDSNSISLNEQVSNIQPIVSISAPISNTSNETTITPLDTIETDFRNTNIDNVIAFQHVKNNSTAVKANSTVTNYSMEAITEKLKQGDNIFGSVTGTPSEITTANFPVSLFYDVGATNLNITVPSIMISNDTLKLSNKHQTPQSTLSTDVLIKPVTKSILENLYPDVQNYTTQDLVVSLITHNSLNNDVNEENVVDNTGTKTINETIPILSTINTGLTETYLEPFKPDTFNNEQLNSSNVELITNLTEEQLSKDVSTFQAALLNNNQTSATELPTTKGDGQITYTVDDTMINSNLFIDNITYNLPLPQPTSYFTSKGEELSTIASPLGNNFITEIFNDSYLGIETTTMTSVESSISLPVILEAENGTTLNLTLTEDINKDITREVLKSTTPVVLINKFKNFTDEINSIKTENESVLLTNINAKPTDITSLYGLNNNSSIIEETQENATTVQDNIKPITVGYTANSDVEAVIEPNLNPYVNVTTSKRADNVSHIENSSSTLLFAKQSNNIAFKSSESVIFNTGLQTELQNFTSIIETPEQQYSTIPRPISESVTSSIYLTNISHGIPSLTTVTERTNYVYSERSNFTEYEQQIRRANAIATKSDIYPDFVKSIVKPLNDSLRETNVSNRVPDNGERQTTYGGRTTSWPLAKVVTIDNQSNITVILPRTTVSILQKQTENSQVTQSIQEAVDKDLDSTSRLLMPQVVITEKQPTTVITAEKRKANIVVTTEKQKPNVAVNRMLLHIASSIDQPNVNDTVKVGTQNVSSNVSQRVHDAFGKYLNNTSTLIIPQVVMTEKQPNIVATTDKHPNNLLTTKKHPNIVVTTKKDPNIVVTAEKHRNIVVTRIQPNMTHSVEVGTQFVSSNLTQSAQETLNSTITFLKPKMDTTEEYQNIGINRMLPRIALSNNQPGTNDSIKIRTQIISLNVTQSAQETFNKDVNSTSTILTLKADATENKSNIAENTHLSSTTIPIIQDNVDNSVKMGTQIVSSNVLVTPSAEQTIGNELDSISTTLPTSKKVTTQKQSNITVNVILSTTLSMAQLNTGDFSKGSTQILNSNGLQSTQSVNNNAEKVNFNITTEPATIVETFNDSHKIVEGTKLSDIVLSPVIFRNGVTNNVKSNSQFNDRKYEVLTETLRNKSFVSNASRDLNTKEDINSDSANGTLRDRQVNSDTLGGTNNNGSRAENYETSTIYNEFTNQIEVPSRSSFAYINALSVNNTGSRSYLSTMYMGNQAKTTKKFFDLQKSSWSNESTNLLNSENNSTKILDRDEKQTESSFKSRISRTTAKAGNLTEHKNIINEQHIKLSIDSVASRTSHTNINYTLSNQIRNKPNSSMSIVRQNVKESVTTTIDSNEKNTTLPVDCIKLPRGKYADSKDCRKFYICIGKLQPVVGTCPNNTVFSEINKQCTRNLSHCVRNNQFHCLYNGRFSDFLKDNIYYICVKNNLNGFHRYKLQCQNDYHLNKVTVKCEKNVEMANQSEISSSNSNNVSNDHSMSMVKSNMSEHSESSEFVCKKEGKFSYLKDCRKYYVCTKNSKDEYRRKIKRCSNDEVYDKKKKKCVSADSEEC